MPDVSVATEFGKLFGFPALCLAVFTYLSWKAVSWLGREILKPGVDDIRAVIRLAGPAAVQVRDDVADVKDITLRIEKHQIASIVRPGHAGHPGHPPGAASSSAASA